MKKITFLFLLIGNICIAQKYTKEDSLVYKELDFAYAYSALESVKEISADRDEINAHSRMQLQLIDSMAKYSNVLVGIYRKNKNDSLYTKWRNIQMVLIINRNRLQKSLYGTN